MCVCVYAGTGVVPIAPQSALLTSGDSPSRETPPDKPLPPAPASPDKSSRKSPKQVPCVCKCVSVCVCVCVCVSRSPSAFPLALSCVLLCQRVRQCLFLPPGLCATLQSRCTPSHSFPRTCVPSNMCTWRCRRRARVRWWKTQWRRWCKW